MGHVVFHLIEGGVAVIAGLECYEAGLGHSIETDEFLSG